jgi:hypothetical protein
VPNAALANSSVTLNGQAVSLGSSGNVNSGATAHSVALNQSAGSAITGVTLGAHQTLVGAASADPSAKTIPDCQDSSGNHLNYTQTTDAFSCGTSGGAGGGANLALSNLTSPTAINLSTLTGAGAIGLTAGGTNQNVTLTPSGSGVASLAGNLQVSPSVSFASGSATTQLNTGLSIVGTTGVSDGDSFLMMTTASGDTSFFYYIEDGGGWGVYDAKNGKAPFNVYASSPDYALNIRPAGVSISTLAAASGNPLCYNTTVDSGFKTVSTCNATVLNNQANTYTTGKQTFAASAAGAASINLPSGTAPTTPAAGDHWYDGDRMYVQDAETNSGVVSSVPRRYEVTSDVSATSTTAVTFATFAVQSSKTYSVHCDLYMSSSNTSNTPALKATCPASPTYSLFGAQIPRSATSVGVGTAACGSNISPGATTTATTVFPGWLTGTIQNGSTAGSLSLQVASSGSYTTTVKQGSFCTLY